VVFWQNLNAHHQGPAMDAIAESGLFEVDWVVEDSIKGSWREAQGWPVYECRAANLIVGPSPEECTKILNRDRETSLHIITGVHSDPIRKRIFLQAMRAGCRTAMQNEHTRPVGRLRRLKPFVHEVYRRAFGQRLFGIFCIGQPAYDWYKARGYPERKLVNWMYTPKPAAAPRFDLWAEAREPRVMFLSSIDERKGADVFVEALLQHGDKPWRASMIGDGPLANTLHARIAESPLAARFEVDSFKPYAQAMELLATSDIAIVPSRFDGWGTVVNEALRLGVPVIATAKCGSADLLSQSWRGEVIQDATVPDLSSALGRWLPRLPLPPEDREHILNWSDCLSGESAAAHFVAAMDALQRGDTPPKPVWMTT